MTEEDSHKMTREASDEAFEWQVGIWDRMSDVYVSEIDKRFTPIIEHVMARADLQVGQDALDLGSGTGAVAFAAAARVGDGGRVTAVDISQEMLLKVRAGAKALSLSNVGFEEGRGEAIPLPDQSQDAVLASLSLMYVIDRAQAAGEIARVLRPGGRLVGSVWAGPDQTDIVRFQQTAGSFAPNPPVEGVGPGAMADPSKFLDQLSAAGLHARVETEVTRFEFASFDSAWDALASVTTAALDPALQEQAKKAVRDLMWPDGDGPRDFHNATHFIIAERPA
jgi:ubiquinone/menaquinone biosynthesis C-methylase UbiE